MVRRRVNKVKRVYSRARGILGNLNILQNPYVAGGLAGVIKNIINGQPPINIQNIQERVTQPNAKNPLIYLLLGYFLKNKPLMAIGMFLIVDPPISDDVDDVSDEDIEAMVEEGEGEKKICIH